MNSFSLSLFFTKWGSSVKRLYIWHSSAICIQAHMRPVQTESGISQNGLYSPYFFFVDLAFHNRERRKKKKNCETFFFFAVNITVVLRDMSTVSILMDITLLWYATYKCMWCRRGQHRGSYQAYFNVINVLNSQLCGERRFWKSLTLPWQHPCTQIVRIPIKQVSCDAGGIGSRFCRFVSPSGRNDFSQW